MFSLRWRYSPVDLRGFGIDCVQDTIMNESCGGFARNRSAPKLVGQRRGTRETDKAHGDQGNNLR